MGKIKLVFTGGTIMSTIENNIINTSDKCKYTLIEKSGYNLSNFNISVPLNKLSENFILDDIMALFNELKSSQEDDVDGIIVLHGTDTLAYTSSYISILMQKCKKKIVFVSSNYPLSDYRANGIANFTTAIKIIKEKKFVPAVYVAYKNFNEDFVAIYLASRLLEPAPYSDCYYSPDGFRYAKYKNNNFEFENTNINRSKKNFKLSGNFNKKCLYIMPYIGLDYDTLKNVDFDYVVHGLYHSGTANSNKDNYKYSVLNFIEFCNSKNKPIYFCNINKKESYYESYYNIANKCNNFLFEILPNVAIAKINIAYNLINEKDRELFIHSNISGEFLR